MGRNNRKTNPHLLTLVQHLKDASRTNEAPIWRDIALRLERPARHWAEVNVGNLDRHANEDDVIVVPGKLLGAGDLNKKVTVAAFRCTGQAKEKVANAGGRSLSLEELVKSNPKGSNVRIMG